MRGIFTASIKISSVSAAKTLLILQAPGDQVVEVLETWCQAPAADTNEQLEFRWEQISSLGSPTMTTLTPVSHEYGYGGFSFNGSVYGNVTASEPTYSGTRFLDWVGAASLNGPNLVKQPETRFILKASDVWGFRLMVAPGTAKDLIVGATFREIG